MRKQVVPEQAIVARTLLLKSAKVLRVIFAGVIER
jgi:hypothetical protein